MTKKQILQEAGRLLRLEAGKVYEKSPTTATIGEVNTLVRWYHSAGQACEALAGEMENETGK